MNAQMSKLSLGLDIGALYVKLVATDGKQKIVARESLAHQGEIFKITHKLINKHIAEHPVAAVGLIGQGAPLVAGQLKLDSGNEVAAIVKAVQKTHPDARQIIDIGGGSLSLVELNEAGEFTGYQTNTVCAAGTGSFLDEQATRLGIKYSDLADMPIIAQPPSVAARCAVFAKSDLIHRQQEGFSKPEMWAGLCKGLVRTILMTLFKGKRPSGKTVIIGGVALNRDVMRWLAEELPEGMVVLEQAQEAGALGAALMATDITQTPDWGLLLGEELHLEKESVRKPLVLEKSNYPSFEVESFYIDEDQNEVRVTHWPEDGHLEGYIGVDIGSTSTKLLMINDHDEALVDIYRKTGGDPINATKSILRALQKLVTDRKGSINIKGIGTTGSGRKLVGAVIGADRVINEITAHVTGAMKADPTIDTIFEIGGQDAKYIHTVNGHLHNANMNYVCAAGTGSFVEELSRKMGFDLFKLGDECLGVTPPVTSDRCTVFMDQDARVLLRKGFSPREVMGAVMYSVVQNYLNKVVGNRYHSKKKIFFQGATARNKCLVAAFENLLDVEVVVSPYCHVMGSWGVALLTRQQMQATGETSKFVGMKFADTEVKLSSETCELCANRCQITYAEVEGLEEKPSWGYLCGREPEEERVRINQEFRLFKQREKLWKQAGNEIKLPDDAPKIGFPRALLTYSYYPLWRRFFAGLGYKLVLSKATDDEIVQLSSDWVGADYCHPVKLAHGHLRHLAQDETLKFIFSPYMISAGKDEKTSQSYFCPYNIALPAMLGSALTLNGAKPERLLSATLDLRWDDKTAIERLTEDLGKRLDSTKREVATAWKAAHQAQKDFESSIRDAGKKAMQEISKSDKPAIVVLGRPYNIYDPGANLALPEKIARLGFTVIPLEFLPIEEENPGQEFENMFWNFGRKITEASRIIARTPNLYGVYFSNFSCGPDSFIQTYAEEVMGEKPLLMLELDEHGADAGYLTRLEAFADVVGVNETKTVPLYEFTEPGKNAENLKGRTLWVPSMGEAQPRFTAAVLRNSGSDARNLPLEDSKSFALGRSHTRGGECVPCPATLGAFLATIERNGGDTSKAALFMPTADGPCRFGQYCTLDRMVFNRIGWDDVPIVSWNSTDSYDGTDNATRRKLWSAILLGDILFKMRCRTAPYETNPGQTEELYEKWIDRLDLAFEKGEDLKVLMKKAKEEFLNVPKHGNQKPLVGIVGEIYVRTNRYTNQDLVRRIEQAGGEAWLAPISEWIIYVAYMESWLKGYRKGGLMDRMGSMIKNRFLVHDEKYWTDFVSPILDERHEPAISNSVEEGSRFVPMDFEGETIITLGRAIEFMKNGAQLVVNCAPFGCMPGAVTSGVFQQIQQEYNVPVANMFYDGEGDINDIIETYIVNIANGRHDLEMTKEVSQV